MNFLLSPIQNFKNFNQTYLESNAHFNELLKACKQGRMVYIQSSTKSQKQSNYSYSTLDFRYHTPTSL